MTVADVKRLLRSMVTYGFRRLTAIGFVKRALADTSPEGLGSRMVLKLCTTPVDPLASQVGGEDGTSAAATSTSAMPASTGLACMDTLAYAGESSANGPEWEEHADGLMVCTSLVSRLGNKWGKSSRGLILGDSC